MDGKFQGHFAGWEDQFYIAISGDIFPVKRFFFKNMAERCVAEIKQSSRYKGSRWKFTVEKIMGCK